MYRTLARNRNDTRAHAQNAFIAAGLLLERFSVPVHNSMHFIVVH